MDDFNTTNLCPNDINDQKKWLQLNKQWVDEEGVLIQNMLNNTKNRTVDPQYETPYKIYSTKKEVMQLYNTRRESRINKQLNECYNLTSNDENFDTIKKSFLENKYPRFYIDNFKDKPVDWDDGPTSGLTYQPTAIGGKSKKSKRTKKSKKSKRTKRTKKSKKSRKHR